ncbi:hypothetical protein IPM62_00675 [Candidatus Woesebacteria bacterium]|nr:MAG: hypothetical protein IPM62_00675 [Candidatus Woesebacteria bacterium]
MEWMSDLHVFLVKYFLLGGTISSFLALLEIQIEGKDGWAKNLSTWRLHPKWFNYFPGANKPLTGYHTFLWLFILTLAHTPLLFSAWSLANEFLIISFVLFVLRLGDFLWFVFNPHYGLKKFNKEAIPWHTSWFILLPSQYWISFVFIALFLYLGIALR